METENTRGVVIVGTGLIARFHAQAVKASGRLELAAVVNPHRDRAEAFADAFGCKAFASLDEALAAEDVGLVTVATPSGAHDDAVLSAARHRVPVLVEKPLTITAARCRRLFEVCRQAETPIGCILQTRFSEDFRKVKRVVESGELGKLTFARMDVPWWRDDAYYEGSWHGTWTMDGGGGAHQPGDPSRGLVRGADAPRPAGQGLLRRAGASDGDGGHGGGRRPVRGWRARGDLRDHGVLPRERQAT